MNYDQIVVLALTAAALVMFVSGRPRVDLAGLLVLVSLGLTGILSETQAIAAFSNPGVVTIWSVFIIGGALLRTGIADHVGHRLMMFSGRGEPTLMFTIMGAAAVLAALLNNAAVVALMLPIVMDLARRTGRSPARLLMPLAFGSILGGMTTLVGTQANILSNEIVRGAGLESFALFDYAWVGLPVLIVGVGYLATIGRVLLPGKPEVSVATMGVGAIAGRYKLMHNLFALRVEQGSLLRGRSLREFSLGAALDVNLLAFLRAGRMFRAPGARTAIEAGDRFLVQGSPTGWARVFGWGRVAPLHEKPDVDQLESVEHGLWVARVGEGPLEGVALQETRLLDETEVHMLGLRRGRALHRRNLALRELQRGDSILFFGPRRARDTLEESGGFAKIREAAVSDAARDYRVGDLLHRATVAAD